MATAVLQLKGAGVVRRELPCVVARQIAAGVRAAQIQTTAALLQYGLLFVRASVP